MIFLAPNEMTFFVLKIVCRIYCKIVCFSDFAVEMVKQDKFFNGVDLSFDKILAKNYHFSFKVKESQ